MSKRMVSCSVALACVAVASLACGARADDGGTDSSTRKGVKVVYPKHTDLDFEGLAIEGQVQNPGEFYFEHRNEDKFDSLVKRRKNFHREMLRDAVLSK